ncbi:hypothetical protein A3Q56_04416 [Intoshia linei]|uniref:Tc3 transposase DNA binding domain-containing protein n=1 Tax=Intoshia linei TaxID=1819745 RepID=A0A177B153_9BILA|nr:hypothetical protein A3Q56_04416 [Intoshia linei]
MSKRKYLNERQKGIINYMIKEGHSQSKIAVTKSRKCIQTYLNNRSSKKLNNKIGCPKTLSPSNRQLLLREASNSCLSASSIKSNCSFNDVSTRTIQRELCSSPNIQRRVMIKCPNLTKLHIE